MGCGCRDKGAVTSRNRIRRPSDIRDSLKKAETSSNPVVNEDHSRISHTERSMSESQERLARTLARWGNR